MCLVISTDTKFDKSHSSIICLTVFFDWAFAVLISFCTILCNTFQGWPHLDWPKTLLVLSNFKRASEIPLLKILSSLAIAHWFLFFAIFTFIWVDLSSLNIKWKVIIFREWPSNWEVFTRVSKWPSNQVSSKQQAECKPRWHSSESQ